MVMAGDQLEPDENGNTTPNEDINPGLGEAFDPDPPVPPPAEEGADNQTPQQDTEGSAEGTVGETAQGETQGQGQEYLEDLENPEYIGTVASDTSTAELMANMARTFAVEKSEDCDESSACLDSKAMENPAYLESPVRLPKSPSKVSFAQEGQTDIVALDNPKYGDSIQSTNSGQPLLAQKAKTFSSATGSGFLTKEYLDVVQHAGGEQALITSIQDLSKSNLTLASLGFGIAGSAISVRSNRTVLSDNGIAGLHTKSTYVKNLVALSISYMFVFTAFLSLRNLQSSINHISGLGLISLSTMYGTLVPGCVVATAIVQKMRPKWSMFVGLSSFVVYTAANFYPSYYTLLPASALVGFSLALSWIAQGTYISSIAITYAVTTGRKVENVMNLFNGIFFTFWQIAQILGNLIASLVLNSQPSDYEPMEMAAFNMSAVKPMTEYELRHINKSDPRDVVEEICGANYCHSYVIDHASLHISPKTLYILLSTFLVLGVVGLVIMAIFLNRLDVIFNRSKSSVCRQFLSIFRLLGNKKMLLCVGLMIYLGLQQAFMFAEVTKAFITCPLGVHMIGYVMICFGAFDAIASFSIGKLLKYVGRTAIIMTGASINLIFLALMLLWQPNQDDLVMFFMIAGAWGVGDAIWATQICSLMGILFPKDKEPAFATMRMFEAVGMMTAFAYSQFLCMTLKIYITGGVLIIAILFYIVLEVYLKKTMGKDPVYV